MTVISNTSPISNLAAIGQLVLLQQVYGSITIPQAVADEIAKVATIYAKQHLCPINRGSRFKQSTIRQLWKGFEAKSLMQENPKQLHP